MSISIKAIRDYTDEPLRIVTDDPKAPCCDCVVAEDGTLFPAQWDGEKLVVIASMKAGEEKVFCPEVKGISHAIGVEEKENSIAVMQNGKFFTEYVFDPAIPKPYLGPIMASDGKTSFTRLDLNTTEHVHQRSVICAVGDVNGVDFWNEFGNYGFEKHVSIENMVCGNAFARFSANNVWQTADGQPMLDEKRTFTFYNQQGNIRYVDMEVVFTASYCDVTFGKTKEAGPLGVRVNEELRADRGGSFTNSYGGINEDECWGKPAFFCDYKGVIDGTLYGIAVMDNEFNERYPTTWHIRNYGLFAANNLFFKGGLSIPKGETLTYKYRLCFYEGQQINVYDKFNCYINYEKE